jgi:hypothetical protein
MASRKQERIMDLTEVELADAIVSLVERKWPRLKLTDEDISEMLFATGHYRPRVNTACHWLMGQNRLTRNGDGVANSPYWYRPQSPYPAIERRP